MSKSSKGQGKQRGPPPSLFLHPSPGASHVSLPGILAAGASVTFHSNASQQRLDNNAETGSTTGNEAAFDDRPARSLLKIESSRTTDRTDALWAEMQATLEEVELSASGGTHVFGSEHDRKLAELRNAQIALAQAWARSEADDTTDAHLLDTTHSAGGDESRMKAAKSAKGIETGAKSGLPPLGSNIAMEQAARLGQKIEGDTEVDIAMARKRREANDQYFERVNSGVLDVVAKLEEVALAMRAVERESKFIWDENKSVSESIKM